MLALPVFRPPLDFFFPSRYRASDRDVAVTVRCRRAVGSFQLKKKNCGDLGDDALDGCEWDVGMLVAEGVFAVALMGRET